MKTPATIKKTIPQDGAPSENTNAALPISTEGINIKPTTKTANDFKLFMLSLSFISHQPN